MSRGNKFTPSSLPTVNVSGPEQQITNSLMSQDLSRGSNRYTSNYSLPSFDEQQNELRKSNLSIPTGDASITGQVDTSPFQGAAAVQYDDDGIPDDDTVDMDEYEDDEPSADPLPQNVELVRVNGKEYFKHKQTGGLLSANHGDLIDEWEALQDRKTSRGTDTDNLSVARVSDGQIRETTYSGITDDPTQSGSRASTILSALSSQDTVRQEGSVKREIMQTINEGGFGFSQGNLQRQFSGSPVDVPEGMQVTPKGGFIPDYSNPDCYAPKTYTRPQIDPKTGKGTGARDDSGNLIMEQFQSKPPAQNKEVAFYTQLGSGPNQRLGTIPGTIVQPDLQNVSQEQLAAWQKAGHTPMDYRQVVDAPSKGGLADVFSFYKTRESKAGRDTGFISQMEKRWTWSKTQKPQSYQKADWQGGATSGLYDPMGFFDTPEKKKKNNTRENLELLGFNMGPESF